MDRFVSSSHQGHSDRLEGCPHPLLDRKSNKFEDVGPSPGPTDVGKTQKIEGFRFGLAPPLSLLGRKPSEFDQPCFLRV